MPAAHYLTAEIPPALRRQLASIPPAHLDELISLALEATVQDPSIDFLTAVEALWRCNAYYPYSCGAMTDDSQADERSPGTNNITQRAPVAQQDNPCPPKEQDQWHDQEQNRPHEHQQPYTYDPDTEMPDAPSPTSSPPTLPTQSSPPSVQATAPSSSPTKPTPTLTPQSNNKPTQNHHHRHTSSQSHAHPTNRTLILTLLRDRTQPLSGGERMSWQRREQLALAQAYLQAFELWPHARSSEKRCEGFLARYVNL